MMWPYVSRRAFDEVASERDRLRKQNDGLLEHLTRVDRREHGMPELAPQPRPPRERLGEMPTRLKVYIEGLQNPAMRRERERTARQRRMRGEDWAAIEADIVPEDFR